MKSRLVAVMATNGQSVADSEARFHPTRGGSPVSTSKAKPKPAPERDGTAAAEESPERNRPVHVVRLRNIRAAVWANETDAGTRYNVTVSRLYKDEEQYWRTSDSFGREDLLLLAKVVDLAHTWISEQMQAADMPF
jgi:hypothetical protein